MIKVIFTLILISVLFYSASTQALAVSQITGRVLDDKKIPVIDAQVTAKDSVSKQTVGSTASDYNGSYRLLVSEGTYDIVVVNDTGNGQKTKTFPNQKISAPTALDLSLNTKSNGLIFENMDSTSYIIVGGFSALVVIGLVIWVIKGKKK